MESLQFFICFLFLFSGNIGNGDCRIQNIPDGQTPFRLTRLSFQQSKSETVDPEKRILEQLQVFCKDLSTELGSVFRIKDVDLIEVTRHLTDFRGMALQLKDMSPALYHELKGKEFIKSLRKITRLLKAVSDESLRIQHVRFLRNLMELTNNVCIENLQKMNSKTLIKLFVKDEKYVTGVELIIHSVFVSSIKVSVESIAESMISKYALHSSKLRCLDENKVHNEMMIDCNGPEIGECDEIVKDALNHHFSGGRWHFNTSSVAVFRTSGAATTKLLKIKSKLMIY